MARKDEDVNTTFYIPENYTDSGLIFGFFKARNLAEACIFAVLPAYFVIAYLGRLIGLVPSFLIVLFVFFPIAILCVIGINGDSLTVFIGNVFLFLKHRKKMRFRRIKPDKTTMEESDKSKSNILKNKKKRKL